MSVAGAAFQDGLGERRQTTGAGNQLLDLVIVHEPLGAGDGFEAALRQRAAELASFQHAAFPRLRGVGRLSKAPSRIVVATDHVAGVRVSDLLAIAERRLIPLEYAGAMGLLQQLLDAVAALHESLPQVSHGALAPERLLFTADARLVVVDQVFGSAIERLGFDQERCWRELRVAAPLVNGTPVFDRRADVAQIGAVALALLLGRSLNDEEYPAGLAAMVEGLNAVSADGLEVLPTAVKGWLRRTLQLEGARNFGTAIEARTAFAALMTVDEARARDALLAFLGECQNYGRTASALAPAAAAPAPQPPASVAAATDAFAEEPAASTPRAAAFETYEESKVQRPDNEVPLVVRLRRSIPYWDSPWRNRVAIAAAVLVAIGTAGVFAVHSYAVAPPTGVVAITTNPEGARVSIAGRVRGHTPLTLELEAGDHSVELAHENQTRVIPVTVMPGGQVSQFVELPKTDSALGQLSIRTDPPGATVTIDGQRRGVSPLVIEDLVPGVHTVALQNTLGTVTERVTVESGATASLVVPMSAPEGAPVSGWVAVTSPVEMQLLQNGRVVGTSRAEQIMMPVGEHSLQIVNPELGYKTTRVVQVSPGRVTPIRIDVPQGSLALNAAPWAEVWVNGSRVGETPIGNVALPIGAHDVVFRHPDLGEQRHTVTVTLNGPARLSVDMRRRQ